jgi:hypothetical protein
VEPETKVMATGISVCGQGTPGSEDSQRLASASDISLTWHPQPDPDRVPGSAPVSDRGHQEPGYAMAAPLRGHPHRAKPAVLGRVAVQARYRARHLVPCRRDEDRRIAHLLAPAVLCDCPFVFDG